MAIPTNEILRADFVATMRANMRDDSFLLLPSQAAQIVAKKHGIAAEAVLLSFASREWR